ncbi:MAG: hypothetical protein N2110_04495 [Flavobacteriales bacterium]|nr:hypothetical protein [Flavobacteriales bacterium]
MQGRLSIIFNISEGAQPWSNLQDNPQRTGKAVAYMRRTTVKIYLIPVIRAGSRGKGLCEQFVTAFQASQVRKGQGCGGQRQVRPAPRSDAGLPMREGWGVRPRSLRPGGIAPKKPNMTNCRIPQIGYVIAFI